MYKLCKRKRGRMKTYDIKITFKSKCSKEDLIGVDDLIYKFIKENFWNVENFKYKKESKADNE